ncbi:MAG: DNA-binding response regulator [Betaproteobacteria bacterium]|jgi:DNA-binding NarL/FixJ family response regulator|nr:DNA-binding response regulator [Betaproteobacteria bacterium]NDF63564.1 DNA-binding response regulator [Betaproteobacteria bacterium]
MNPMHPSAQTPQTTPSLSSRELQVLMLLSTGRPIKRVALDLGISAHTVNQHVRQIYLKLAVHNRIMALNRARQLGLLVNDGVPLPRPTLSY